MYAGFSLLGGIGGSPPTSRKFAHYLHLETLPPVDLPSPNFYPPMQRLIPPNKYQLNFWLL